jgi:hypothetical protein
MDTESRLREDTATSVPLAERCRHDPSEHNPRVAHGSTHGRLAQDLRSAAEVCRTLADLKSRIDNLASKLLANPEGGTWASSPENLRELFEGGESGAKKVYYGLVYFRRECERYITLALAGTRREPGGQKCPTPAAADLGLCPSCDGVLIRLDRSRRRRASALPRRASQAPAGLVPGTSTTPAPWPNQACRLSSHGRNHRSCIGRGRPPLAHRLWS